MLLHVAEILVSENDTILSEDWHGVCRNNFANNSSIYRFSRDFMFYCLSGIVPVGLLCNTLTLAVFLTAAMRRRASSWYLASLAISDNVSLICLMFDYWLKNDKIGLQLMRRSLVACLTFTHLSYASRLLSAWLVTTFTVERFIGVAFPMHRSTLISIPHAKKVISLQLFVSMSLASFTFFTIGIVSDNKEDLHRTDCDVIPDMTQIYLVCNVLIQIIGSIVVPVLMIVTLNVAILQKVCHRGEELGCDQPWYHHEVVHHHHHHHHNHPHNHPHDHPHDHRNGNHLLVPPTQHTSHLTAAPSTSSSNSVVAHQRDYITSVLLAVSATFVILNIPYCICWFVVFFSLRITQTPCGETESQWSLFAAKYIASVPYFLNYGINFVLYSLCARAFRKQLRRVLSSCFPCFGSQEKLSSDMHDLARTRKVHSMFLQSKGKDQFQLCRSVSAPVNIVPLSPAVSQCPQPSE